MQRSGSSERPFALPLWKSEMTGQLGTSHLSSAGSTTTARRMVAATPFLYFFSNMRMACHARPKN